MHCIYNYDNIYIRDSQLNRPESVSLARQLLASERSERDTLRSVQLRIAYILLYIYIYILGMCSFQHKWASEHQLYLFVSLHHFIMK